MTADGRTTGARGPALTAEDGRALERCIVAGGVAVLPTDTVYGLAADPESPAAVARLYELKRRPPMPSAVMFLALGHALAALPELGDRTRAALERLLPGPVTVLLPDPDRRYPLAAAGGELLGVRVPVLSGSLAALAGVERPLLQSSANEHGGRDPRRLGEVPEAIRAGADVVLDGGALPGVASTVVDLGAYEDAGRWEVVREGAVAVAELGARL